MGAHIFHSSVSPIFIPWEHSLSLPMTFTKKLLVDNVDIYGANFVFHFINSYV